MYVMGMVPGFVQAGFVDRVNRRSERLASHGGYVVLPSVSKAVQGPRLNPPVHVESTGIRATLTPRARFYSGRIVHNR